MPGRRVISDLDISWEDVPPVRIYPPKNPWQKIEDFTRNLAAHACGCAAVLGGIHLFVAWATV